MDNGLVYGNLEEGNRRLKVQIEDCDQSQQRDSKWDHELLKIKHFLPRVAP